MAATNVSRYVVRFLLMGRAPKREKREEVRDGGCALVSFGTRVLQETLGEKTSTSASANTGWARVGGTRMGLLKEEARLASVSRRGRRLGRWLPSSRVRPPCPP